MTRARRAIVEVRSGLLLGAKAILLPGEKLRIGRTERAHLIVPRDAQMSGLHCELSWDGVTCRLRDEKSARGTLLGGQRIEGEADVAHGSWIQAGETSFSVYFEAETPPRASEPLDPIVAASVPRALEALKREVGHLFGVFDAARDPRILELLREAVDDHRSLYEGIKGEALADVAPYLVCFRRDSGLLDRIVTEGWGRSFGIFVSSRQSFKAMRRHFRRFLMVEEDDTFEKLYFRFYDPRVLREIMPISTVRQRDEIFDGLEAIFVEGERGEVITFDGAAARPALSRGESHAQDP
ncbi:Hypothetical protein A7982_11957 [Minicystis rosea]|nr:Hypothetical protein A7982_11957 [Minicystis rosea]